VLASLSRSLRSLARFALSLASLSRSLRSPALRSPRYFALARRYNLAHALRDHKYDEAAAALVTVRRCLYQSSKGLPAINSDLDNFMTMILNEKLPSVSMIAQLAAQDGEHFKARSQKALEGDDLEKAAAHANAARNCYGWILARRQALLNPPKREAFESDESELNLDVDESLMKNVPEAPLLGGLMDRFTSTFHQDTRGHEDAALMVSIPNAHDAIRELDRVAGKVAENNSLKQADGLLQDFYEKEAADEIDKAFESLDSAKAIYTRAGYPKQASGAQNLKYNTMGDLAVEKAGAHMTEEGGLKKACADLGDAIR
jgi:hypothetical protein